jgi:hypothetical protein
MSDYLGEGFIFKMGVKVNKFFRFLNEEKIKKIKIIIAFIVAFLPCIFWIFIVNRYGVNIYQHDQWVSPAPQIEAYFKGSLNKDILFQQHNENRQVFPRIFSLALTILGHQWNTRWEMFLGLVLSTLISLIAFQILQQTNKNKTLQNLIIIGLFNYLFFSIATWYFRFLSITFERLLVELSLMLNLLIYTLPIINVLKLVIFIISGFIAQYSHSSGIIIWPLSLLLVLNTKYNRRYKIIILLIYLLLSALACVLYFWDYHQVSHHSSLTEIIKFNFLQIARFILAFLGNPLADEYSLSVAVGLIFFSSFLIVALFSIWQCFYKKTVAFNYLLPWLVLGIYPIGLAIIASITRLPMSKDHALRADYIIHSMYLPLATLALMAILGNNSAQNWLRQFFLVFIGLFLGMFVHYDVGSNNFDQLLGYYASLQRVRACTQLIDFYYSEDCWKILYLAPRDVVERIRVFDRLGLLRPGLASSLDIDGDYSGKWGYIDRLEENSQGFAISGWATLEKRPADAVIITHEAENQAPKILAILATGQPREDVSKFLNNQNFNQVGWGGNINLDQIPTGANICSIHAYGFDNERNRLFPLKHSNKIAVTKCQLN